MEIVFVLLIIAMIVVVVSGMRIANRRRVRRNQEVEDYQSRQRQEVEGYQAAHSLLDKSIKIVGQSLQIDSNLLKARLDYAIKYGDRRDTAIIEEEFKAFKADREEFSEWMIAAIDYDRKRFERLPLDYTKELRARHMVWRIIESGLLSKERDLKDLHEEYFTTGEQ